MTVNRASNHVRSAFQFELTVRACPGCGSENSEPFASANIDPEALDAFAFASRKLPEYMHYALGACQACDLLYANPAPDQKSLEAAYRDAAFDASDESRHASVTYGRFLREICKPMPDRSGALDIGTGDGAFLEQLIRNGFSSVVGVEPSAAPVNAAKPELRRLIRHAPFRPADFSAGSLRLVTCFQTLEHVCDPLALARDSFQLLKPGGAMFIVCHNWRALLARAMGLKSPIFDIEHLQLFSPESIKRLFERAGFSRIFVRTVVNSYSLKYWARLFPFPPKLKAQALELLHNSRLGRLKFAAPVGNLAAVGYK